MKKVIIILLPILLLGAGAGLALTGVINIPGISPKAKAKATQLYTEATDTKVAEKKLEKPAVIVPKKENPKPPKVDASVLVENKPEVGQKKLAKLWNEIEAPALISLVKDWKDNEVAGIFMKMDSAKVAEVLGSLDPKRASAISRELQKQASIVPKQM
jgi:flagellar motility protein MotE (MotC chaperone)